MEDSNGVETVNNSSNGFLNSLACPVVLIAGFIVLDFFGERKGKILLQTLQKMLIRKNRSFFVLPAAQKSGKNMKNANEK
jgi:hypothetical protein